MIRYILHGGASSKKDPSNDTFFKAFLPANIKEPTILFNYWARDDDRWQDAYDRDLEFLKNQHKGKKYATKLSKSVESFEKDLELADVLYLSGGSHPQRMFDKLGSIKNLKEKLENKLVIGSSAGTFTICTHSINSFTWQDQKINTGLGLLPLNVLCHWDIEEKKDQKIKAISSESSLPIITLKEAEYVSFVA